MNCRARAVCARAETATIRETILLVSSLGSTQTKTACIYKDVLSMMSPQSSKHGHAQLLHVILQRCPYLPTKSLAEYRCQDYLERYVADDKGMRQVRPT